MKFFINEVEVREEEFADKFLNMRILEEEKHDLTLLFVRAFIEGFYTEDEKRIQFMRTVAMYEVRRCFRESRFITILGQLFEIRQDAAPVEQIAGQ